MDPHAHAPLVLVHGAWHGGWCWQRVSLLLREAGRVVLTPTLSGLADRAHVLTKETGLETHIADIVSLMEYEDLTNVVLVGHSYGGMVITGVAAAVPERIRRLVYLDAFVPQTADALLDLLSPERAAFYTEAAAQHGEGWRVPPPPIAALGLTDAADVAWVESKLTDQPLLTFTQPVPAAPGETSGIDRTYIHSTEGPIVASFAPFAEQARADTGWTYHELKTGHDAMVTLPEQLSALLLSG